MNRKLLAALAAAAVVASSASFAAEKQGFYVGADLGYSRANDGDKLKDFTSKPLAGEGTVDASYSQNGFGWRAFAGYNFSRNFAIEAGYTRFADNSYRRDSVDVVGPVTYIAKYDVTHKTSAWDLVGKASLPIADSCWDVYAKGGVAYQKTEYSGTTLHGDISPSDSKFRPIAGVGTAYNFDNGVTIDVSWTRVFGNGETTNFKSENLGQPDSDLVSVGLIYNFQNWA